jgi:hypothetical protein
VDAIRNAEGRHVDLHSARRDVEPFADLAVREHFAEQFQYFRLPTCCSIPKAGRPRGDKTHLTDCG